MFIAYIIDLGIELFVAEGTYMDSGRHMGTLMVQVAVVVDFAEPD